MRVTCASSANVSSALKFPQNFELIQALVDGLLSRLDFRFILLYSAPFGMGHVRPEACSRIHREESLPKSDERSRHKQASCPGGRLVEGI